MRTKIISTTLALLLILAMLPVGALAANETFGVEGMNSQATLSSNSAVKNDGSYWTWGASAQNYAPVRSTVSNLLTADAPYRLLQNGELWQYIDTKTYDPVMGIEEEITPVKVMDGVVEYVGGTINKESDDPYLALKSDGTLLGWGGEQPLFGEGLGIISNENAVILLTDVKHVELSNDGWMALKNDGTLWSAGYDVSDVLNPGAGKDWGSKPLSMIMENVAAFSVNFRNALVIKTDGSLWSWGDNAYGQVGNGGSSTHGIGFDPWQSAPVKILDDVIYASADTTSFAITSDGTLYGWGINAYNQLGFAGAANQTTPVRLTDNVAMAAGGGNASAIVKRDGTLWTAGRNTYGQTGHSTSTYPGNVSTFTKLMDDVAFPDGMVGSGTSTGTPMPTPTPVASNVDPNAVATASFNAHSQTYTVNSSPMNSTLYFDGTSVYTRVELVNKQIAVETYNSEFELLSASIIPMELSAFGGFYCGEDYNYFIFGASNPQESDNCEVARIVMYTKDWQRINHASFYGSNTYEPFQAASLRCTEYNGMIIVHTGKTMYTSSKDGKHHQANMGFCAVISELAASSNPVTASERNFKYVSHSFNQFIFTDSLGNILTLNHGDGYPRAAVLTRHKAELAAERYPNITDFSGFNGDYIYIPDDPVNVFTFVGNIGMNKTGASLGGVVESGSSYLVVGNSIEQDNFSNSKIRNIFVTVTDKSTFSEETTSIKWLTNYPEDSSSNAATTTTPHITKINDNRFLVMWDEVPQWTEWLSFGNDTSAGTMKYLFIDGKGNALGQIFTASGALSDCEPILVGNDVVWYTTYESLPTFYKIDSATGAFSSVYTEPAPVFTDMPENHWAASYVTRAARLGLVSGVGDNKFEPERNISNAEWATMIVNLFYINDIGRDGDYWWSFIMDIAGTQHNVFAGTTVAANGTSNWDAGKVQSGINRLDMAQVICNIAKEQGWTIPDTSSASSQIADWASIPTNYREAVAYCFSAGFVTGVDSNGTFSGASTMTRAQAATVLCRLLDAKNTYN